MRKIFILQSLILLFLFVIGDGCKKQKDTTDRSYIFICNDTVLQGENLILFVSATNASTLFWDFGDGTSQLLKPWNYSLNGHTFSSPGTFKVSLTVNEDSIYRYSKNIVVLPMYAFYLSGTPLPGDTTHIRFRFPLPAGNTYLWDFGDGRYSTDSIPYHVYTINGTFTVRLAINNGTSLNQTMIIYPDPIYKSLVTGTRMWTGYGTKQSSSRIDTFNVPVFSSAVKYINDNYIKFMDYSLHCNSGSLSGNIVFFQNSRGGLYYDCVKDSASFFYSNYYGGHGTPPTTEKYYYHTP